MNIYFVKYVYIYQKSTKNFSKDVQLSTKYMVQTAKKRERESFSILCELFSGLLF